MFLQLGYLPACMGQYPRCARRSGSGVLTFAPWDVFWGGSGVSVAAGVGCAWGGEPHTRWTKLTRTVGLFLPFVPMGRGASKGALWIGGMPSILHVYYTFVWK